MEAALRALRPQWAHRRSLPFFALVTFLDAERASVSPFRQKATSDLNGQSGQDAAPRLSRAERHLDVRVRLSGAP